jgi:hypothetical protein
LAGVCGGDGGSGTEKIEKKKEKEGLSETGKKKKNESKENTTQKRKNEHFFEILRSFF